MGLGLVWVRYIRDGWGSWQGTTGWLLFGPPVRPLLILATRCRSWRQVDLQKLILATCCCIQWTSCSPVADPGDTLSHLEYGDCGCSCWWYVATVDDTNSGMLIIVALLAADGKDVVLTSPPCWWTRHESTTVQWTRVQVQRRRRINGKKKVQLGVSKVLKSKSSEVHKSEVKKSDVLQEKKNQPLVILYSP